MKHSKKLYITILAGMFLFSSCYTSMKVKVDIFDKHALTKSTAYREAQLLRLNTIAASGAMFGELRKAYKKTAVEIIKEASAKAGIAAADPALDIVSDNAAKNVVAAVRKSIEQLSAESKEGKVKDVYAAFTESVSQTAETLFKGFASDLKTPFAAISAADWKTITDKYFYSISEQHQNIVAIYGNSIIGDPLASIVAQAPDKYWRKFESDFNIITENPDTAEKSQKAAKVNRAGVKTFMGNADIAIKMDAPGVFVIKGVRLDADEAIKASFKVLNQGVKYLAYANGVPVNSPAGSAENTGKIVMIPEKMQNDSLNFVIQNHAQLQKEYRTLFLNQFFSQLAVLDAVAAPSDAEVKRTVNSIQEAFKNYLQRNTTNPE